MTFFSFRYIIFNYKRVKNLLKGKYKNMNNYENIREVLQDATKKYPDNNAFILKNKDGQTYKNITFTKMREDINHLGTALLKMGLKDKRIAIISKNRYEWAISYYAVVNGLGIVVPLDKSLPDEEIELSLKRSKADVVIFEDKFEQTIKNIFANKNTNISLAICMDDIKINENSKTIPELLEEGKKEFENNKQYENLEIDNDKTSIILFTSGTTDIAKAVELSHRNIASNITGLDHAEVIYPTDVNMAFLPFHHTFGSTGLLFFLQSGAATVFCDGLKYVAKNLKEYKVSVFFCVPLIIEAMHKKIKQEIEKQGKTKKVEFARKISRALLKVGIDVRRKLFKQILDNLGGALRFVISGAAAIDKQVAIDFNDFGILTVQGYGLTETSPVLTAENEKNLRTGSIRKTII